MQNVNINIEGRLTLRISAEDAQALLGLVSELPQAESDDTVSVSVAVANDSSPQFLNTGSKLRNRRAALKTVLGESDGAWFYTREVQKRANQLLKEDDRWVTRSARQSVLKHLHALVKKGVAERRVDPASLPIHTIPPSQWRGVQAAPAAV